MLDELSRYPTPRHIARALVSWARITPGQRVLEPSAGSGTLVRAAQEHGASVTAVELDALLAMQCEASAEVTVIRGDFLGVKPTELDAFDLAVLNPPWNDGQAVKHLQHAMLFAPRAVALLRLADLACVKRLPFWRQYHLARIAIIVPRPRFVANGGRADVCAVDVRTERVGQTVEWVEWRGYERGLGGSLETLSGAG